MKAPSICASLALIHLVPSATFAAPVTGGHTSHGVPPPTRVEASPTTLTGPSSSRSGDQAYAASVLNSKSYGENQHRNYHITKSKLGDNSVFHALMADPHALGVHSIISSAVHDQGGAAKEIETWKANHNMPNKEHAIQRLEVTYPKPMSHERGFINKNIPSGEYPTFNVKKGERRNSVDGKEEESYVHMTGPLTISNAKQISQTIKDGGGKVTKMFAAHGNNSEQAVKAGEDAHAAQGEFLKGVDREVVAHHPGAKIYWSNSHESLKDKAMNTPVSKLASVVHEQHINPAMQDNFFGRHADKLHKALTAAHAANLVEYKIGEPLPPNYKQHGKDIVDAVTHMKSTQDKDSAGKKMVNEGRAHFYPWALEAPKLLEKAIEHPNMQEKDKAAWRLLVDRTNDDNFYRHFRGNNEAEVEHVDPVMAAGHRQAQANIHNDPSLPHYVPIKWESKKNRWNAVQVENPDPNHRQFMLKNVDAEQANANHFNLVTKDGTTDTIHKN